MKELQTQLLETRLLYTTTIEDYDVVCVVHTRHCIKTKSALLYYSAPMI